MKKLWIGGAVVLVVVAGGVLYFLSNLNSIVAKIIEQEGSAVVETDVAVSGVDIKLSDGRATLAGLSIASPKGYTAKHAFTLGEITVDIDLDSVRGEPIIIDEIVVEGPVVTAEFLQSGASNIAEIQKTVQQYAGSAGGEQKPTDQKRIRIKHFVFNAGSIEVDADALGLGSRSLNLPAISLEDIGGAEGARPDAIAKAVFGALTRKAMAEIAKAEIEGKVKDAVADEAKNQAKGLMDKIGK